MFNKAPCSRSKSTFAFTSLTLSIAALVVLCAIVYCVSLHSTVQQARASAADTGAISSSPASGPVGTTVSVSGSGWSQPDGTLVYLGYIVSSNCSLVSDSQNGSFSAGAFSGWLRWPTNTAVGPYTVCAIISGIGQTVNAGSFNVLSTSAPQVSITPSALQENQQATITATNYLPASTIITFDWATTSNSIEKTFGTTVSNSSGTALFTFTVPITTLASGQYLIEAIAGGGHPSALFSSANFSYTAPVVPPSPTPSPNPSPSPTPSPTQGSTPTVTVTVPPTATAAPSPGASATPAATPTQAGGGAGATPTSIANGATPTPVTSSSGSGGSSTSGGQSNSLILVMGMIGALAVLIALAVVAVILRRRQRQQLARVKPASPTAPPGTGQPMPAGGPGSWGAYGSMPGQFTMPGMNPPFPGYPARPPTQAAPPNGSGLTNWNGQYGQGGQYGQSGQGGQYGQGGQGGPAPMQAPPQYSSLLRPTTPPPAGPMPQNGNWNGMLSEPVDPTLDAMRRQAQAGLFVAPTPRGGNGPS
jgi:hypothetical protein